PVREGEVEWLDPEPIARKEQPAGGAGPERKGEHPLEVLPATVAGLFVEMEDGLRVASRAVPVPALLKAGAEGGVIVDLTVVGDPDGLVLVCHGLMPAGDIHDRQPSVAQPDRAFNPQALAVRAPVPEDVAHALQARLLYGLTGVQAEDAGDPKHSPLTRPRRLAPRAHSLQWLSTSRGAAPR